MYDSHQYLNGNVNHVHSDLHIGEKLTDDVDINACTGTGVISVTKCERTCDIIRSCCFCYENVISHPVF